ncbi:ARM repeat-containing protein [Tilletiaria anomala UBC 951]|uniref:ARM repeat-containing protein n=1 Tax=Tilletiaria anomala (strain ATCC 24038 / CBS 436.72 / UBC 951) TaxID=1037660 RepID=A0A066W5U5_TILAU|nr:ARM repeat-containing protein [Tilletiaria anomala UBC 951]KDN46439.1 ARM repeat-containing protein [Tilletiaria anomala UBC 951]
METNGPPIHARAALLSALIKSTSSVPHHLEEARKQLDEWESDTSFWRILLDICFNQYLTVPIDQLERPVSTQGEYDARRTAIRTAGIIRFKNGVDKFWRLRVVRRVGVAIPTEEKTVLRSALLRAIDEPERVIALQASVAIARIARHDYPNAWPDLFTNLQQAIVEAHTHLAQLGPETIGEPSDKGAERQRQTLRLMRAVDIVQRTLKELDSMRMLAGKIRMTELADTLLPTLQPMFAQYFDETFPASAISEDSGASLQGWARSPVRSAQVRTSHLFLKALQRLVVSDAGALSQNATGPRGDRADSVNLAQAFFRSTPKLLQTIATFRRAYIQCLTPSEVSEASALIVAGITKHLLAFGKIFLALLNRDKSKAATWDGWPEVVEWYWQQAQKHALQSAEPSATNNDPSALVHTPSRFVIQTLLLLKSSLSAWKDAAPAQFTSPEFAQSAADTLVGKLMRLSKDELADWEADSEQWSVAESQKQEQFELEIRTAAERTLMVLADAIKPKWSVGHLVWRLFEQSTQLSHTNLEDVLTRDAIYAAVGRLRDRLPVISPGHVPEEDEEPEEQFDLSTVIGTRLAQEAAVGAEAGSSWVIIRRRIAWLMWEWSEHVAPQHRPATYTVLVDLIADMPGVTDVAVRLSAARSLGALADAVEFDAEAFTPFLAPALTRLISLATSTDLQEMNSIKVCTDALSMLIERLGPRVAPFLEQLVSLVPPLWNNPDPEFKAKPSILSFVSKLVRAVELLSGGGSEALLQPMHQIVDSLVRSSFSNDCAPHLGQDALALWARSVHSTTAMTTPLFELLELAPVLLQQAEETPEVCRIVEETALLVPKELVQHHGRAIFSAFSTILADPLSPVVLAPLGTLDFILQALQAAGAGVAVWPQLLQETRLLGLLVGSSLQIKESAIITSSFVSALARITIMAPPEQVLSMFASIAPLLDVQPAAAGSDIIAPLLSLWAKTFENMHSPRKRKATAMALAAVVSSCGQAADATEASVQAICTKLPEMAAVWSDCLGEIREHCGEAQSSFIRSMTSTEGLGQGALDTDEDDWLEDTSPGTARLRNLAESDFVISVDLAQYISSAMSSVQQRFPTIVQASLTAMDPLVLEILMTDLK